MENEAKLLQDRLQSLLDQPQPSVESLKDALRFFAQEAVKSLSRQEKLIRISDSMQEMIREQRNQLEVLNHQKSALFSIISHDLGSPFANILNGLELLRDHYPLLEEQERLEMVGKIHGAGKNLKELLDNLLQWANIQMHGMRLSRQPMAVGDLIRRAVGQVLPLAAAKEIRIQQTFDPVDISVDEMMLDTVLRNLLSNAIKFSPRGGEIHVQGVRSSEDAVLVEVSDDGLGMDQETRKTLFDIAAKTSLPGTEMERGTGLGLIICQEMLSLHGSTLQVDSAPGRGSRFSFPLTVWPSGTDGPSG